MADQLPTQTTPPSTPPTPTSGPAPDRRKWFIVGGAIAAVVLVVIVAVVLMVSRPVAPNSGQPIWPMSSAAPMSGGTTLTPDWTYLAPTAQIRPGIYVKVVRPAGIDLSKEAGFDKDFITTLPVDRILYVVQGPVRANSLSWIQVTDGAVTGWGVQDYVVAYGIKNSP